MVFLGLGLPSKGQAASSHGSGVRRKQEEIGAIGSKTEVFLGGPKRGLSVIIGLDRPRKAVIVLGQSAKFT